MPSKATSENMDGHEDLEAHEECGLQIGCGKCKSRRCTVSSLNCLNNAKGALCFLSIVVFIQGMVVNGFVSIVISTLERRFHLQSSETGFISSCYEIGVIVSLPVVTYVGGRGHKPLWLGWGIIIMSFGSVIFCLPHFVAPEYTVADSDEFICGRNATANCGDSSLRAYRGFFIAGQLLHGIGASPLYTLALTYLDANVKQSASSVYHGTYLAFSMAGPGIGYLLGGVFLRIYVNPGIEPDITTSSSLWIGNWWMGFLMCAVLAAVFSIPILMYPKQLPGSEALRKDREKEMHQNKEAILAKENENFGKSIRDAPRCLLIILKNPMIVCISIAGAMDSGVVNALGTFGPKYIEAMFNLTASNAAFYFGVSTIVSAALAHILGGIVVSKFDMKVQTMMKFCIACSVLGFACFFMFLIRCDNPEIAGVNTPHNGEDSPSCKTKCGCSTDYYNPICGADGMTYLSFCDAECQQGEAFTNCTRVLASPAIDVLTNSTASAGRCDVESCPTVAYILVGGGLSVFLIYFKAQAALQVSLRSVPFYQRSFALGIQWLFIRVLGQIPLPIILGEVLDLSCIVWGEECGQCGACKVYDNHLMSSYMTALSTSAKGLGTICFIIALLAYKPAPSNGSTPPPPAKETDPVNVVPTTRVSESERRAEFDNAAFEGD